MISKIRRIWRSPLFIVLCSFFIGTMIASCTDDNGIGSSNVGLGIKTFFPTKVVTNQPMTINGSGFLGATEIEFPGGAKVTNFEVVSDDMIRVNAPAGIPEEGGHIIVRSANEQVESRLPLTLGHTLVSGYSKQDGENATGGELISVYGTDLEFINAVELLDADGVPQIIDQKDFYRKGTNSLIFRVPLKNIFEGTFVGKLHTYDGREFLLPEITYEPSADGGHMEIVKTVIWSNDGTHGPISWGGEYRFASESNSTGEEVYTVPQDIWNRMKTETFYVTVTGENPQIRVTDGWWSTTWTGVDIQPGSEYLEDLGNGTYTLTVNLAGDPLLDVVDVQHLLFTGDRYTVQEIYFEEETWVDGGGDVEVKVPIWTNDGSHGAISWSSEYRFASESNSTGEEVYTVPQDIWDRMKTETFYVTLTGENPQIRVTDGWWSTTWTGVDIQPGNEFLEDLGDGTYTLTVNLAGDPLLNVVDVQHLLFTGDRYTVQEIYFIEVVPGGGGGSTETVFWEGDGSAGAVSWNGTYRFALEGHDGNNECIAEFPQNIWDRIKTETFYVTLTGDNPQIRVTDGWWSTTWTGVDIQPGSEYLEDLGDGIYTLTINLSDDPLLDVLDAQHLLLTGDRYTPLKLYFK